LGRDLAKNKESQDSAAAVRTKENEAFTAKKEDLDKRITMLEGALEKLKTVPANNKKEESLIAMGLNLKEMAEAAGASLQQLQSLAKPTSFLQMQKYDPQSGAVLGTVQSVLDTTVKDLEDSTKEEEDSLAAYEKMKANLKEEENTMEESKSSKTSLVSTTSEELASKQAKLEAAETEKSDDEAFLADMNKNCAEKTRVNTERLELRRKENNALQMALKVLDSDRGARVFGKTEATSFLQLSQEQDADVEIEELVELLRKEAETTSSKSLKEVAGLAKAAAVSRKGDFNPFAIVLDEIETMKKSITKESGLDMKQRSWCEKETAASTETKEGKERDIESLDETITQKKNAITGEPDGLLLEIKTLEENLAENAAQQKKTTLDRRDENQVYAKNIQNLVSAEGMLKKAISILSNYYSEMDANDLNQEAAMFLQLKDAPETAGKAYGGQSESGAQVITAVEEILKNAEEEETESHATEEKAQELYEGTMQELAKQETDDTKSLTEAKMNLATTKVEKANAEKEKEATENEKASVVEYLRQIKPSCDFISKNFDKREASREKEADALTKATELIKESPAYEKLSDVAKRKR